MPEQIERAELYVVKLPLVSPFAASYGEVTHRESLILRLVSGGVSGWGECSAFRDPFYSYETIDTSLHIAVTYLIPLVLRSGLIPVEELMDKFGPIRGHHMSRAMVENAFLDLHSRIKEVPLYQLIENRFSRIEPSVVSDIDEFKRGLIDNVIEHCPYEMDNDIIDVMIQFAFENFQVSLSDCGTWAGRGEMALITNHLRVNIYSYGDDRGKAYLIDMYKIMTNDRWSVIRIFNIKQIHYEPIGRLLNGKYYFTT